MKKSMLVLVLLQSIFLFAQSGNPEISKDVPTALSPSPSVAALMKFEEVPVSNYTGVPNISIPLYTSSTLSKSVPLDLSLKYHIGATAVDEKASDVGLGWSLFAGGSISRTVRGLPDEIYDDQHVTNKGVGKIGVYHTTSVVKNPLQKILNYEQNIPTTATELEILNEFLWNTTERGIYDMEYDLWQFNFMGKTGRFTIKKNATTNLLEIADLNLDSNLRIINYYNPTTFEPLSFEIYDELGNKYVFDVKEKTKSNSTTTTIPQYSQAEILSNFSKYIYFNSAFHLSRVKDNNNMEIINITYDNTSESYTEHVMDHSTTYNFDRNGTLPIVLNQMETLLGEQVGQLANIDPKSVQITTQRIMSARKILQISVQGQCKIDFLYQRGREDDNFYAPYNSYVFKGIVVKNWKGINIKNVNLHQGYSITIDKRMILDSVSFGNYTNSVRDTYKLEYKLKPLSYNGEIKRDSWGYFTLKPSWMADQPFFREVNPEYSSIETLQKMIIPSKGCILFNFEANRYSFIGDELLSDFSSNLYNWTPLTSVKHFTSFPSVAVDFFTITEEQDVYISSNVNTYGQGFSDYRFVITKEGSNQSFGGTDFGFCNAPECEVKLKLAAGTYKVKFSSMDLNFPKTFNATINANYKKIKSDPLQYRFGGGNRIDCIGYFADSGVPKDFYETNTTSHSPAKETRFEYTKFGDTIHSSGSLATPEPVYEFEFDRDYYFYTLAARGLNLNSVYEIEFYFTKITETNNRKAIKTSGADVGYQNVTVKENANGRTEYTYNSPIDFPEEVTLESMNFPYKPTSNLDYKRSLINKTEVFNEEQRPVSKTVYKYEYLEVPIEQTSYGVITNYQYKNLSFMWLISNYNRFQILNNWFDSCTGGSMFYVSCRTRKDAKFYIRHHYLHEANGWAKLSKKVTENYFYPPEGSAPTILNTEETYTYNGLNKKISEQTTTTSTNEILKTKYYYHTGNSPFSQNRISEIEKIETYTDSELLSKSQVVYSNTFAGNQSYLPLTIQTAKGTNSLENNVKYNRYDAYSHILEVQQENGTLISYIWGYNNSQPIAKIENASYASIESQVANLQLISDTSSETALLAALNNLRTTLPNAMVTTFTYIPLVGISTVTDPKGDQVSYFYDAFNRLQEVRDKNNNIVSENQYNYRP